MQHLAVLLVSAMVAASGLPGAPRQSAAEAAPTAEVYVAELDADWNVSREIRAICSIEDGCTVDLPGADAQSPKLHVRFDAIRGGAIAVSSAVEDAAGSATVEPAASVTLDRTGFGATHFATVAPGAADGQRIIMMAVKTQGWSAPIAGPAGGTGI